MLHPSLLPNHIFMHHTLHCHTPHIVPSRTTHLCTMHCTTMGFIPHPGTARPTTNQLNKCIDVMTAALARAPSTNQNKPPQTRLRSSRYQPYNTGQGSDMTNHPNDENTRSNRPTSNHRKTKVGSNSLSTHDQNFMVSTDPRGLSACAICLSRNPHDVMQCDANVLWDGHNPTFARKGDKGAKLRTASSGDTLCLDWNLPRSCNSNLHLSRHRCSGCGNNDHGAQTCRLAQPKVQN